MVQEVSKQGMQMTADHSIWNMRHSFMIKATW